MVGEDGAQVPLSRHSELEIMKLREDLKKKQGAAFNLQQFHDNLMLQGLAPIKVIRKAMLQDDSPVL